MSPVASVDDRAVDPDRAARAGESSAVLSKSSRSVQTPGAVTGPCKTTWPEHKRGPVFRPPDIGNLDSIVLNVRADAYQQHVRRDSIEAKPLDAAKQASFVDFVACVSATVPRARY